VWECTFKGDYIEVAWSTGNGNYVLLAEPYCRKCASQGVTSEDCSWHEDAYGFNRIYAMGCYIKRDVLEELGVKNLLSSHILGLKLYPRYAEPLGEALALCITQRYPELLESDFITPVPRARSELKIARDPEGLRYNQTLVLAEVISSRLDIPTVEFLEKTRSQRMSGLTRAERRNAVQGLYTYVDGDNIKDGRILIIDDVSTSNATASECAKVLLDNGAQKVNVLVAGRNTNEMVARLL